jgi:hypothetical protein
MMTKVSIDTGKFVETLVKDKGELVFTEEDVYRFIIDSINAAGLDSELRYQDTDYSIIVGSEKAYVSYFSDDPAKALIETVRRLCDEINSSKTTASWMEYKNKEYSILFEEKDEKN